MTAGGACQPVGVDPGRVAAKGLPIEFQVK